MNRFNSGTINLLGLWMGFLSQSIQAACPTLTPAGLQEYVKNNGPTEVHFFASWCVDCARHIRESPAQGVIFVATFDEKPSAEKAYAALGGKAPCFTDDGIADAFKIKAVPAMRKVEPAKKSS